MNKVPKLDPDKTLFFLCDVQTRFSEQPVLASYPAQRAPGSAIYAFDELVLTCQKMLKIAKVTLIPINRRRSFLLGTRNTRHRDRAEP